MSRQIRPARRYGTLYPLDSVRMHMPNVAREVYGARADWPNSSLTAFAYLYRRFGPPPRGTDGYKHLGGAWLLTTRDPDVYQILDPGGCEISLFLGQYVSARLHEEAGRPGREWRREWRRRYFEAHPSATPADYRLATDEGWDSGLPRCPRCPPEIVERALAAHRHLLNDLLRPVYVDDVAINLFGRISDENPARGREAPRSKLAGWGVPVREMERRINEE
jgi:hypothetical protein